MTRRAVAARSIPTTPVGISTFTVARHFNTVLHAPFGIKTLTVGGSLNNSQLVTNNPLMPASGFLTTLTVGDMFDFSLLRSLK